MNRTILHILSVMSAMVVVACQTNPENSVQPGMYNYTPGFFWGETSAAEIVVPEGKSGKGFAITCREAQYCLNRATDLCKPNPISIISTEAAGERAQAGLSTYGGGANRTTTTLMQVACGNQ